MLQLQNHQLSFQFPKIHDDAVCEINFQRTFRIPDDNREYPLPPGLGRFPIRHVDDCADKLPAAWKKHGGVFIPMYQSEALWIRFTRDYPCAVKIAAGKINAVSGEPWSNELSDDPQDYLVLPDQPWLDGFNVSDDFVRQFVAMPLGEGFSAEEQITGKGEHGGLQLIVYPMKREFYREMKASQSAFLDADCIEESMRMLDSPSDMGLAPGGLMRQKIYEDEHGLDAWDQENGLRCFVHLANSEQYQNITGHAPPHKPVTAEDYTNAGLPWFDYYSDDKALSGSDTLNKLTSVAAKNVELGKGVLPGNNPVIPKIVKTISKEDMVRDGEF